MGGWGELYPIFFGFLESFNFAMPLTLRTGVGNCVLVCSCIVLSSQRRHNNAAMSNAYIHSLCSHYASLLLNDNSYKCWYTNCNQFYSDSMKDRGQLVPAQIHIIITVCIKKACTYGEHIILIIV